VLLVVLNASHLYFQSGGLIYMIWNSNGFDQYDPSNVPPPNYHDVSRRPRVPDIITFYGALLVLLFLVKYFVQTLLRQLRRGREEPDRPFATRRSNQVPSIVVSDSELKKG
jgi:hypothetical protein